jgi:hypothetical protein
VVVPAERITLEPEYTSLLFNLDQLTDPLFSELVLGRNSDGKVELNKTDLVERRAEVLEGRSFPSLVLRLLADDPLRHLRQHRRRVGAQCSR